DLLCPSVDYWLQYSIDCCRGYCDCTQFRSIYCGNRPRGGTVNRLRTNRGRTFAWFGPRQNNALYCLATSIQTDDSTTWQSIYHQYQGYIPFIRYSCTRIDFPRTFDCSQSL